MGPRSARVLRCKIRATANWACNNFKSGADWASLGATRLALARQHQDPEGLGETSRQGSSPRPTANRFLRPHIPRREAMTAISSLLILAALSGTSDTVLVQFTSQQ